MVKTASISSFAAPGTHVTYSYKVTNTGNVTLTAVEGHRPHGRPVGRSAARLHPGPAGHRDLHRHLHHHPGRRGRRLHHQHRHGHRHRRPPGPGHRHLVGDRPGQPDPVDRHRQVGLIAGYSAPGTPVTYTYAVTNTGNVTLTAVRVTDPMVGLSRGHLPGPVDAGPGGLETCTATYTTTQADVDAGSINNTGTATGTPPTGTRRHQRLVG